LPIILCLYWILSATNVDTRVKNLLKRTEIIQIVPNVATRLNKNIAENLRLTIKILAQTVVGIVKLVADVIKEGYIWI